MVKTYETLKVETATYVRFKGVKHLLEFQNAEEYSISEFVNILLDSMGKGLVNYIGKLEKPKS